MSDEFFRKAFGDDEPVHIGSGWISGVCAVFLGLLALGGTLCLRFPEFLTLPEARAKYPIVIMRVLIQGMIFSAFAFAAASAIMRQRKILALTGAALALAAAALGGGAVPLPQEVGTKYGIGLDWFLLDLFVMTLVFVPLERIWPLHPGQGTFRAEWTTDSAYFVATHLPAQLLTFLMLAPAALAAPWLAIPKLQSFVAGWPFVVQLSAVILVADLAQYVIHRAFHRIPVLWRFHAVHHSIRTMDWIAGSRSHFFDIIVTRGLIMIPLALCGFSQGAIVGYILFVSFHATFSHLDFRPRTIWLENYLVTPRYHHWHHSAEDEAIDCNFAIHFPWIDRLFGTQHFPKDRWPKSYGLSGASVRPGFFRQFVDPFLGR
ncbi:MAG TPA: sterol desaturase family protein [Steroidobacteraceae bacterium]|nr:sterol desaturase family protein [Steroidobacteraceae bacterium]